MKNNIYKSVSLIFIMAAMVLKSNAQTGTTSVDPSGIRYNGMKVDLAGSKYLYEGWNKGAVKMADGKIFSNIYLMYDITRDMVIFRSENNESQVFRDAVKEFSVTAFSNNNAATRRFKSGYPAIDGGSSVSYYEVLADGSATLLKRYKTKVVEEAEPGTLYKTKQVIVSFEYYIVLNDNITRLKRGKKPFLALLGDKAEKVQEYIATNKLDLKDDDNLAQVINYYNTN